MSRQSWRASGSPRARIGTAPGPRPEGSLHVAIERARVIWDGLTGGPTVDIGPDTDALRPRPVVLDPDEEYQPRLRYSELAAAAIMDAGLRLWSDTAATMTEEPPAEG